MQKEQIQELFKEKNFRATPQRIAVYKYVYGHRIHPDAAQIYESVLKNNPSFSKTTVYNALKSLCESGFLIPVTIEGGKTHYDANVQFHGHFICSQCGEIYDFDLPEPNADMPNGFSVERKDVYYSGICQSCSNKNELKRSN